MPRDKTATNIRVMIAAREVFLEHGYEQASIRDIAEKAGITSAGLYRHCKNKEDLFCQVVQPAVDALDEWINKHLRRSYASLERRDYKGMKNQSEIEMVRKVAFPYRQEFRLLLNCSQGTRYENFFHTMVESHEKLMLKGIRDIEAYGIKVKKVSHEELHIIISAYMTALMEPILHDFDKDKMNHYLDTIEAFFMPGWHELLGI
ncbi:MAG: TetR/AcrR family transcriptional regulator [Eubacterium sp.]|nr:TetR/AcrR family transcriptional regulator [Eubacterium sp.]